MSQPLYEKQLFSMYNRISLILILQSKSSMTIRILKRIKLLHNSELNSFTVTINDTPATVIYPALYIQLEGQ